MLNNQEAISLSNPFTLIMFPLKTLEELRTAPSIHHNGHVKWIFLAKPQSQKKAG